jgi:hypothetical protein
MIFLQSKSFSQAVWYPWTINSDDITMFMWFFLPTKWLLVFKYLTNHYWVLSLPVPILTIDSNNSTYFVLYAIIRTFYLNQCVIHSLSNVLHRMSSVTWNLIRFNWTKNHKPLSDFTIPHEILSLANEL